jgi:hypothetical protein
MITVANLEPKTNSQKSLTNNTNLLHVSTVGVEFGIRQLSSCWSLIIIVFLFRSKKQYLNPMIQNFGVPATRRFKNQGRFARIQISLSF